MVDAAGSALADPRSSSSPPLTVADLVAAVRSIRQAERRALFGDLYVEPPRYWLAPLERVFVDRGRIVALSVSVG